MLGSAIDRRERRLHVAAAAALVLGIAFLCVPPRRPAAGAVSWESLLAPYSQGAPLTDGFRIDAIRRGAGNDIVIVVNRPGESAGVEVHVLERGRWPGVRESRSFSIGYETPRSPAPAREAITDQLAETIRSRDPGMPPPDAIPLTSSDSSVLPRWLDGLGGWGGALLGASLALLVVVSLSASAGLCLAGLALGAIDVVARVTGLPRADADIGGAWTLAAAALLLFAALRGRLGVSRRDAVSALAITAIALALRFALGPWGPLHVNGYALNFVFAAARNPNEAAAYGPGYVEIFGPLAAVAPSNPDWMIFACNALLSGLVATLAFAIGRGTGIPRRAAAAAALLLAIDPIAIRMSATETYFTPILFLSAAASVALLAAARELAAGGNGRAAACLGAAGLLLSQAVRIHPAAWVVACTVPFVALAADGSSLRRRALAFVAGGAMIGGLIVSTSGDVLLDVLGRMRSGTMYGPSLPPSAVPLAWVAAGATAYAAAAPRRRLAVPAFVALAALVVTRDVFWESRIWQQSSWRLYATVPAVALAAVFAPLLRLRRVAALLVLPIALGWLRFAAPIVAGRTTDHLEYRWVRERLRELPPECRVIHVASAQKRHLVLPTYVRPPSAPAVGIVDGEPRTVAAALSPAACLYYVRTSLCSSAEGRAACDAIERRLALVPVARASFPARPSRDRLPYDTDPVESVIARVDGIAPESSAR